MVWRDVNKDKNGNKYLEGCMFLVPADFNEGSLRWFSSKVCSAAHRIPLRERWVGSGALGFFPNYLLLSSAEASGEAGFAPFPKSCGWSAAVGPRTPSWTCLMAPGHGGLWCLLLPVCNQKWLTETQRNGNWNPLDFQTVVPAVLSHVTLRCVHRAAPWSLVLLRLSSFPGCNQLSE